MSSQDGSLVAGPGRCCSAVPFCCSASGHTSNALEPARERAAGPWSSHDQRDAEEADTRLLIAELCKQFYHLGWVTGTGGGVSIRDGHNIYIAPSGVQKERLHPINMFVLDYPSFQPLISPPACSGPLRPSQCTPLFLAAYRIGIDRPGAEVGSVIHTHSPEAVDVTILCELRGEDAFVITHHEMIKGIRRNSGEYHRYQDELVIPIIDNTPQERDLEESLSEAIRRHPEAPAVLVRRHGLYVWGRSWRDAKTQCECLDALFNATIRARLLGCDMRFPPAGSKYLHDRKSTEAGPLRFPEPQQQ
ncbi:hypothetical protein H696_01578 [Fonticula alba]|uniref:Probable methylthioribulose-1-phosphate dehydratase n=1 Tax=Fonticula alba TaxID=691883 RepID=A0A058ZDZ6_FONAL|nr:hypothetical protein H696_01578 [Fonticula alba]KCV72176.1 hypothetical protein H696_01578 [Fonticula alba]|eukprot:XP_009493754.1 hypothetical protein H696_01578 [Fonticula alba]